MGFWKLDNLPYSIICTGISTSCKVKYVILAKISINNRFKQQWKQNKQTKATSMKCKFRLDIGIHKSNTETWKDVVML